MIGTEQVEQLRAQHADLEVKIEKENQRPRPDDDYIHQLKREKLRIKDELQRLEIA
ncbi:MAG: YdcH family protein [Alphaproteobacteria bacterium]|nr:YdcH family protein [Alphaproteobacteria bacterium]